ncbi:MAG: Gldg family protein, partial [Planctomycetes bacterium]|nr:Gldg family protein [Planctomycetota bacterium]
MAVDTPMNAGRRRLMFGANALFSIVLAVGVLIMAVYLAGRYKMQFDWTSSGVNSLSPRTVKLIKSIDQDVTVTALYTVLTEYSLAQKRQDRVRDLLDLYESVGGSHIATSVLDPMKDQSRLTPILERLKNKSTYKDEAAPHDEVLQRLPKLVEDLQVLLQGEIDQMGGIDPQFQGSKFAVIQRNLQIILAEASDESEGIMSLLTGELPEYGRAIQELTKYLPRVQTVLEDARAWATSMAATTAQMSEGALSFYGEAGNRYADMLDRIAKMMESSKDLKKVALEKIYADLRYWGRAPVILVETESEARVLSMQDVWPQRRDPDAPMPEDGDTREFAGERALSSALLQLTQKEKTAVIFTYWGGPSPLKPDFSQINQMMMNLRQMPTAPYQRVNAILQDANFVTDEWDVQKTKQPPVIEDAARVIYIVFRPTVPRPAAPNQPSPPGISPADKKIILDAVSESGLAFFLTGWSQPTGPMQFIPGGNQYEYTDYLAEQWGVNVRSDLLTIAFQPIPGQPGLYQPRNRTPFALTTNTIPEQLRYSDHEIVQPLRTLDSFLWQVAPLEILSGEKAVEGVHVAAVVEVAPSTDIWAIADVQAVNRDFQGTQRGTKPREADLLLVVGARLGEMTTQGYTIVEAPRPRQSLIHVHASAEELGRVFEPTLAIQSGMAEFVEAAGALTAVDGTGWREWAAEARRDYEDNR